MPAKTWMIAAAGLLAAGLPVAATAEEPTVAVANFDYTDTSGEVRDQTAEHEARLEAFRSRLETRLADGGPYVPVALGCPSEQACSLGTLRAQLLLRRARDAGADYLVFGEVHKMSTLVGFGRIDVLDVEADRLVFDRVISFRGDTDEAFDRAADFVADDILRTLAEPSAAKAGAEGDDRRGVR
ncbi:DUF2380 domain-containing protein [Jiella pelagia]|uniref:DUF2380 domain-containing protein n=1 Tax=Jiella pelagia TaxID=2986949 RepID=A0ABY7C5M7_9HYPH|nr:DUF2380 domain-containing protein [Jiella pelagia]WAP70339.1 DUF2380 domain-containing protein [Jiella pelagia]